MQIFGRRSFDNLANHNIALSSKESIEPKWVANHPRHFRRGERLERIPSS